MERKCLLTVMLAGPFLRVLPSVSLLPARAEWDLSLRRVRFSLSAWEVISRRSYFENSPPLSPEAHRFILSTGSSISFETSLRNS